MLGSPVGNSSLVFGVPQLQASVFSVISCCSSRGSEEVEGALCGKLPSGGKGVGWQLRGRQVLVQVCQWPGAGGALAVVYLEWSLWLLGGERG